MVRIELNNRLQGDLDFHRFLASNRRVSRALGCQVTLVKALFNEKKYTYNA